MHNFSIDAVIPVFNGQAFITEAIDSVLAQTNKPSRLIVVNDGSTDATEKIVLAFRKTPVPIKYLKKRNGGLSSARNAGIKASSARFLAFLDADDIWEREKLEKQISLFKRTTFAHTGVVYCDYQNIDEDGHVLTKFPSSKLDRSWRGDISQKLLSGNRVAGSGSAVLVKRECFLKAGLFDERLPTCEDWDMWLRIAKHYDFDFVQEKLVRLRRHSGNMQRSGRAMFIGNVILMSKLMEDGDLDSKAIKLFRYRLLRYLVDKFPDRTLFGELDRHLSVEAKEILLGNKFYLIKSLLHIFYAKTREVAWHHK